MYYNTVKYNNKEYYITYNVIQKNVKVSTQTDIGSFNSTHCRIATIEELWKEFDYCEQQNLNVISGILNELLIFECW